MKDLFYPSYHQGELDPQARVFLNAIAAADLPPLSKLTPQIARDRNIVKAFSSKPVPVASIRNMLIDGPFGEIPLRIFTPEGEGPFPALVYLHGGGWVVGALDDYDAICTILCHNSGYVVVSVGYHLSPEARFPVAIEEGYATLEWLATQTDVVSIDPLRLAVGGDSAGGNMAAVIAMMARDREGPVVNFQLLICPVTNLAETDTLSYRQFGSGLWVSEDLMEWYTNHYLENPEDVTNPYASPLLASNLLGLPPAFIVIAEFDIFRDEGEAYAKRLQEAGVDVLAKRYNGQIHDFVIFGKVMSKAGEALTDCCRELKRGNTKYEIRMTNDE
ncbi:MAG: alpha/beta hydrolase [Bacteroidia bacterium]|nr:alpha/beta hydrolase [Bacteroidia bacterium]